MLRRPSDCMFLTFLTVSPCVQTVVMMVVPIAGYPVQTQCPVCKANGVTNVTYTPGGYTWIMCGLLIFTG